MTKIWIPNGPEDDCKFADRRKYALQAVPIISKKEVADLIIKHWPKRTRLTAYCAVELESTRCSAIVGDVARMSAVWDCSVGLFQIKGLRKNRGTGKERDIMGLFDPEANVIEAYRIFKEDQWIPWSSISKPVNGSTALAANLGQLIQSIPLDILSRLV